MPAAELRRRECRGRAGRRPWPYGLALLRRRAPSSDAVFVGSRPVVARHTPLSPTRRIPDIPSLRFQDVECCVCVCVRRTTCDPPAQNKNQQITAETDRANEIECLGSTLTWQSVVCGRRVFGRRAVEGVGRRVRMALGRRTVCVTLTGTIRIQHRSHPHQRLSKKGNRRLGAFTCCWPACRHQKPRCFEPRGRRWCGSKPSLSRLRPIITGFRAVAAAASVAAAAAAGIVVAFVIVARISPTFCWWVVDGTASIF